MRTIKPEIWDSRDFQSLSMAGRLAFLAAFSLADDQGRLATDASHLRRKAAPEATVHEVARQLAQMERQRMVQLYTAKGEAFLSVVNFPRHQKPDKPQPSTLPEPPPLDPIEQSLFGDPSPIARGKVDLPRARARADRDRDRDPTQTGTGTGTEVRQVTDAERVFAAWAASLPPGSRVSFTDDRRAKVKARLEKYGVEELCAAVSVGWHNDAIRWPGRNQQGAYELTVLLRSDAQAEKFINLANLGPTTEPSRSAVESARWRRLATELESGGTE